MTKTAEKKTALEKTLEQEVREKACKMSSREVNRKIDGYLDLINSKKIKGENLIIIKEKARLYAEIILRRSSSMRDNG